MKSITAIVAFLILLADVHILDAATLNFQSGFVRYKASLKTLGVGGHTVSAVNKDVIGKIIISDEGAIEGGLIIPVAGFDSDNSRRDKDVANILKYKEYPAITFEVLDIAKEDIYRILESDSGRVNMKVRLSTAGGSKQYDIVMSFHSMGLGKIHFETGIDARFSDFGLEPPRLGWILKTAEDEIYLDGALIFELEE